MRVNLGMPIITVDVRKCPCRRPYEALNQSPQGLFRTQLQDSTMSVIRYRLPLALVAFLCSFSLAAFVAFVDHAKRQMWTLFRETHEAIEKIQPGTEKLDAAHPLQLAVEDLAEASPLSECTRRWLGNSSITVAPDKPHPGRYCCWENSKGITFVLTRLIRGI